MMKKLEKIIADLNLLGADMYEKLGADSYTQRCKLHDIIEKLKQIKDL